MGYLPTLGGFLRVVGGVIVVSLGATAGLLYRYQTSLIYPASFPTGSRSQVSTPDEFDLPFTEEEIVTPDGERVRVFVMLQGTRLANSVRFTTLKEGEEAASHVRASSPTQTGRVALDNFDPALAAARPTVLFFHANAGNMGHRLPLAAVFYKRFGCNVVMLSYRGYGFSSGHPNERGIRIDAQSTLDWVRNHEQLGKSVLVAYGQSIGGAVAIDLASRNPRSVHSLIIENTFLSIPELIPHVLPPVRPFAFLCREYWTSGEAVKRIPKTTPILFLSGRQDELVPPAHMDKLFERCPSTSKVWKAFPDGTHNDTCVKPKYFDAISEFLLSHVVPRVHDATVQAAAPASAQDTSGSDDGDGWHKMTDSEINEAPSAKSEL